MNFGVEKPNRAYLKGQLHRDNNTVTLSLFADSNSANRVRCGRCANMSLFMCFRNRCIGDIGGGIVCYMKLGASFTRNYDRRPRGLYEYDFYDRKVVLMALY